MRLPIMQYSGGTGLAEFLREDKVPLGDLNNDYGHSKVAAGGFYCFKKGREVF